MTSPAERRCTSCDTPLPDGVLYCPACGASAPTEIVSPSHDTATGETTSPEEMRHRIQAALGDGFEVRRRIGRGGFGEVWEALDLKLGRSVAVKVLRPELTASASFRERFRREARSVAKLRHPGVVPIYHVGEAGGLVYFIMPLVEGSTLKTALEREGRLTAGEATRILTEATTALKEAHRRGIVHRDLKPENFMLDGPDRRVILMDFGIAQSGDDADRELTGAGLVMGSPEYMSPEQATGERTLDGRSDIYSLGVVGYRMLAGKLPFNAETAREILTKHVFTPPEPLAGVATVPPHLAHAVMRCLAKKPSERWQTADDLLAALSGDAPAGSLTFVESPPVGVPGAPAAAPAPRRTRRRVVTVSVLLALFVVGVVGAGGWWMWTRRQELQAWERKAVAVNVAYTGVADSLRALAAGFAGGSLTAADYLAGAARVQASTDQRIADSLGPVLDDLSIWPDALRRDVERALGETVDAVLPGGPLTLEASGTPGCVMERRGDLVALEDGARGDNCWWSVAEPPAIGEPIEYDFAFRITSRPADDAGIGVAWCPAAEPCRVLFLWSLGRVEWASHRSGTGLTDRRLVTQRAPIVGAHRLRVRLENGETRAWLDDTLWPRRAGPVEAARVSRPGDFRLVVQNAGIELSGPGALLVVGARPRGG